MDVSTLNSVFTWVGIIAAFLSAFSFVGTWYTGKVIDDKKSEHVGALEQQLQNLKPTVFSQEIESLNVPDGDAFRHTYRVSVDAPSQNGIIITNLMAKPDTKKIGKTEGTPTGVNGVRSRNGFPVDYQDFLYTFKTNKPLDPQTESVMFSFEAKEGGAYIYPQ